MNIKILEDRSVIIDEKETFGTQNENNITQLTFDFPEVYNNTHKKIVFLTDDGNFWDIIENNLYTITNSITKYKNLAAYVWLTNEENQIDFRSKIWNMSFYLNKNADNYTPSPEQTTGFDRMIDELNEAIEGVENINIDISKIDTTTTVTITDREGIEKSVQIEDGNDYVITEEDYEIIEENVKRDIQLDIPSKTSDLDNDSGFIDNTVDNLVNYYDKTESNDLLDMKVDKVSGKGLSTEDYTTIEKNKLSSIEQNADVNTIEKIKVNSVEQTISSVDKSVDITVPTKTSDITNDSGFIDKTVDDLTNYYTESEIDTALNNKADKATTIAGYNISDAYTKSEVDTKISSVYKYKGSVNTYSDLPNTDLTIGDVYNVESDGNNYAWTGITWDKLGGDIDLSDYYNKNSVDDLLNAKADKSEVTIALNNKVDKVAGKGLSTNDYTTEEKNKLSGIASGAEVNVQSDWNETNTSSDAYINNKPTIPDELSDLLDDSTHRLVTDTEKSTWNAKYDKPVNGIPKTDLESSVQTSLGKADTAIQDVSGKEDKSNKVTSISSSSTDIEYPSAKLVYNEFAERDEEISSMNRILNEEQTIESESNALEITDTAEGLKLSINAIESKVLEQESREGYNLIDITTKYGTTQTISGVTFVFNDDGTITLNGTSTSSILYNFPNNTLQPNNYYMSGCPTGGGSNTYITQLVDTVNGYYIFNNSFESGNGLLFNLTSETTCRYRIRIENGVTLNNVVWKPLLCISTISKPYEPYGAMPSIDYPSEVKGVSGDVEIKVENKNLMVLSDYTDVVGGISITVKDGIITLNGSSAGYTNKTLPGIKTNGLTGNYIVCYEYISGTLSGYANINVYDSDSSQEKGGIAFYNYNEDAMITLNSNKLVTRLYFNNNAVFNNYKIKPMLIKGTVPPTTYVEHQEQTQVISLGDKTLYEGDGIVYRDSKWYWKNVWGKIKIDETYSWNMDDKSTTGFVCNRFTCTTLPSLEVTTQTEFDNAYNNYAIVPENPGQYVSYKNSFRLRYVNNTNRIDCMFDLNTVAELQQKLAEEPMTVIYKRIQTTYTEITDRNLISQLNNLLKLKQYKELTYVEADQDATFTVEIGSVVSNVVELKTQTEVLNNIVLEKKDDIQVDNNYTKLENTVENMKIELKEIESKVLEQESREGYNLANITFESTTINGVTIENDDQKIKINGTATATTFKGNIGIAIIQPGTYTISASNMPYAWGTSRIEVSGYTTSLSLSSDVKKHTITVTETTTLTFGLLVAKNATVNYETTLQVVEGTEEKPYEQYGVQPSIDYPSEVKGVSGDVEIKVENKNILKNGVKFIGNAYGWYDQLGNELTTKAQVSSSTNFYNLKANTPYTIKADSYSNISSIQLVYIEDNTLNAIVNKTNLSTAYTFTPTKDMKVWLRSQLVSSNTETYFNIQLEQNSNATPYIEHKEQIQTISLGDKTLYEGDGIVYQSGEWYFKEKMYKVDMSILNKTGGVGSWSVSQKNNLYNFYLMYNQLYDGYGIPNGKMADNLSELSPVYSNMFKAKNVIYSNNTEPSKIVLNSNITSQLAIFAVDSSVATNVTEWIDWLQQNKPSLIYTRQTPTLIPITDTTLLSQLNPLLKLLQYEDETFIEFDQDVGFTLKTDNLIEGINNLQEQINDILEKINEIIANME